jgi:hypothetical protein
VKKQIQEVNWARKNQQVQYDQSSAADQESDVFFYPLDPGSESGMNFFRIRPFFG